MIQRIVSGTIACMVLLFATASPALGIVNLPGDTGSNAPAGAGCVGLVPLSASDFLYFKSWDAYLCKDEHGVPQFTSVDDVWKIALVIIDFFAKLSGYLAVGFIIWGGVKYLKSQGESAETGAARQIITNALMGLVICIISVTIVQFIAGAF